MNLKFCCASHLLNKPDIRGVLAFIADQFGISASIVADDRQSQKIILTDSRQKWQLELGSVADLQKMADALMCRIPTEKLLADAGTATPWLDNVVQEKWQELQRLVLSSGEMLVRKCPWPEGKKFAVALSHDVDLTRKYSVRHLLTMLGKLEFSAAGDIFQEIFHKKPYWNFDDFIADYRGKQYRATFFFIAKKFENLSYRYSVTAPKFRQLFKKLQAGGHEAGLHSSRYVFDHPKNIAAEKHRLQNVYQQEISGVRQHYLRLTYPQAWLEFQQAGFAYDSSVGLNEINGFKAGTSLPYQPWPENQDNNIWEVPFSIMDYPLKENARNFADGYRQFEQIAGSVIKNGGLLNILWHPSNLAEPDFSPYWHFMMRWLEGCDFFQDTLRGIVDWRKRREQTRVGISRERDVPCLQVENSLEISDLAVEILLPKFAIAPQPGVKILRKSVSGNLIVFRHLAPGTHKFELQPEPDND